MAKQLNEICNLIAEVNTRNQKITDLSEELKREQQKSLNYYFKYKKAKNKVDNLKIKILELNECITKLYNENKELKEKLKVWLITTL